MVDPLKLADEIDHGSDRGALAWTCGGDGTYVTDEECDILSAALRLAEAFEAAVDGPNADAGLDAAVLAYRAAKSKAQA